MLKRGSRKSDVLKVVITESRELGVTKIIVGVVFGTWS